MADGMCCLVATIEERYICIDPGVAMNGLKRLIQKIGPGPIGRVFGF